MRKKLLALLMVAVLVMSMLTGCAQVAYMFSQKEAGGNTETYEYNYDDETVTEEEYAFDDTEEATEEVTEEENSEEGDSEEVTEEKKETTASGDVDFEVVEATLSNPAKIGEWVATKTYCAESDDYRTIYFRITGVIRGEEAQKIVDEYNDGDHFVRFDPLEHDTLEYCVVTYETHYPADFPEGEYGLYEADVDLSACNLEDSGSIENFIGLSSVWDISEDPDEFHAGDTFKDGKAVFAMVKGFSDYLFYSDYYDDSDEEHKAYVKAE
ncbi:MAG: hypothetical protein E7264_03625 [Lachnospiraceae bacterium]|nr:hypothetical protein [Lachnospiraceae bacterium]